MSHHSIYHTPSYKSLIRYARNLKFGQIHTKIDPITGLHAIIAVHSTKLGPAIGGCRFMSYKTPELALKDVLRLAYAMTLKAAACDLPHGGAKAVILKPNHITDRKNLFCAFGDFVHELNGQYITAVDMGSTIDDMTIIAERTPYVIGAQLPGRVDKDPSPATALGIFRAMQAAIEFRLKKSSLKGIRVAIQGVGHVGYHLTRLLIQENAIVTIADINQHAVEKCKQEFGVSSVDTSQIDAMDCDIFSPCAMGATINLNMIQKNKAKIIAGSANNQLAHHTYAKILHDRGTLYLPDFFINAGGLMNAAMVYTYQNEEIATQKVNKLYDHTLALLKRAESSNKTTSQVAEEIAHERLR